MKMPYNKEKRKEYYEKYREHDKAYRKTEQGKKVSRINDWKIRGVINDDFDKLYDYYINCKYCEECEVELVEGNYGNRRCLDHDHKTGEFRNVLCHGCNIRRGFTDRNRVPLTKKEKWWKYKLKLFILS